MTLSASPYWVTWSQGLISKGGGGGANFSEVPTSCWHACTRLIHACWGQQPSLRDVKRIILKREFWLMPLCVRTHPCHEWTPFYTPLHGPHHPLFFLTNFPPFGECSHTPLKASSYLILYPTNDGIPNVPVEWLPILLSIGKSWVQASTRLTGILTETCHESLQTNFGKMPQNRPWLSLPM